MARERRNGSLRNHLLQEDDPAPNALPCAPPHVESQIHLGEIAVEGNRTPQQPRLEKPESDQTDKGAAMPLIQLHPLRKKWIEQARIHFEGEQHQIPPLSL